MTITRRNVLLEPPPPPRCCRWRPAGCPRSRSASLSLVRRQRPDRRRCAEVIRDRAEIINGNYDYDLPLDARRGCPGSRGAKGAAGVRRSPGRSAEGAPRPSGLITPGKGLRHHRHLSSAVAVTVSQLRALPDPVHLGRQLLAQPASPRPEILFPRLTPTTRCSRPRCSTSSTP